MATSDIAGPRVVWSEAFQTGGWERLYTICGGGYRAWEIPTSGSGPVGGRIGQAFIAISGSTAPRGTDTAVWQTIGTMRKLLQRGDTASPDPGAEAQILESAGIPTSPPRDPGDLALELLGDPPDLTAALRWADDEFELEPSLRFDSEEERLLLERVEAAVGPRARWLYPQVSLDRLLSGFGAEAQGDRRVDFLFSPPGRTPLVIEVDGEQHASQAAMDENRDQALRDSGIEVVRVPASETRTGGPVMVALLERLRPDPSEAAPTDAELRLAFGSWVGTALGLSLLEGLESGLLAPGEDWTIHVSGALGLAEVHLPGILELLGAVDELWAGYVAPPTCTLTTENGTERYERVGVGSYVIGVGGGPAGDPDLTVRVEIGKGPQDRLPTVTGPTVVVRSSTLPIRLADRRSEGRSLGRPRDEASAGEALQRILRFIFAKKEFRPGQEEAIRRILRGKDCVVLLPTGAGKSMIYQLAGLVLPGRTLIIDPIIALIEDQRKVLNRYGVDRVVDLSHFVTMQGGMESALHAIESGDALFFLVSPERLQRESFRQSLRQLTTAVPINVAVIDEAHCISEWGHDFRPSYLGLGATVRTWCESPSGEAPPLLALTGTASRSVLVDVLAELEVDRSDPDAVTRPDSFGRSELHFEIIKSRSEEDAEQRLKGLVRSLPQRFGVLESDFFAPPGRSNMLGIVFCPHVNGPKGIVGVRDLLTNGGPVSDVAIYSGSTAPRGWDFRSWGHAKRRFEDSFRRGEVSMLAATKAFGMGIDLPNIRYTIHFGIPGSIEAFYQEAGRAGRDRGDAHCFIVFSDVDPVRNRELLADDLHESDARTTYQAIPRALADDVHRQLFFHFNSFQGRSAEAATVAQVLDEMGWVGDRLTVEIPDGSDDDSREQAIVRLRNLGVITDYTVHSGFKIEARAATAGDLVDSFLRYVDRTQPGRVEDYREKLRGTATRPPRAAAADLGRALIDLTYDTIERARRRSLREMWLLASQATDNTEIKTRIEDYFREGDLAPILDRLLESPTVALSDWWAIVGTRHATDAGELRGISARYLESYPDHPGLLLLRAGAELLADDGDSQEFKSNLAAGLIAGIDRYSVTPESVTRAFRSVLTVARRTTPAFAIHAWTSWEREVEPRVPADDAAKGVIGAAEWEAIRTSASPEEAAMAFRRWAERTEALAGTLQAALTGGADGD